MVRRKTKQGGKYYFTRELARSVAKAKMKKAGARHTCKRERVCLSPKDMRKLGSSHIPEGMHRSWFGNNWRAWAMKGVRTA